VVLIIFSKVLFQASSTLRGNQLPCTVIVGGFFGDEGKGKIAAYLAMKDKPDICVRGGNGPNAGHTVIHGGVQYSLRLIPSGFVNPSTRLLIGPGVPVDPTVLLDELRKTDSERRIEVDNQCAIVEPRHKEQESRSDHLSKIVGSTKSGVGACNAERALRLAKLAQQIPSLKPYVGDTVGEIQEALSKNKKVMIEGTQGTFLSLYHGTYPYVTSKDTTASAACADVGVGPTQVDDVIVIFKAYVTRVGEGPLEGQLERDEVARRGWTEFGTVTGRERRAAPFDFKLARRAVQLNGATQIALTKLDVLFPSVKGARQVADLDDNARTFISKIEQATGVPVTLIGTGPREEDIIDLRGSNRRIKMKPLLVQRR
jgi:adenylosuccinate synthase